MALKTFLNIYFSLVLIFLCKSVTGQPEEIHLLFDLDRPGYGLNSPLDKFHQDLTREKLEDGNLYAKTNEEGSWGVLIQHKRGKTILFDLVDYVSKDKPKLKGENKITTSIMAGKRPKDSLWDTMAFNGK